MSLQTDDDNPTFETPPEDDSPEETSVEDVLSNFREKWQQELKITPSVVPGPTSSDSRDDDFESRAKTLFLKGVEMERNGKLYEAIQYYRKAVQMVPDIEFRLDNTAKKAPNPDNGEPEMNEDDNNGDSDDEIGDILAIIQRKMEKCAAICNPKFEQKNTHISVLPMEMILQILRWVVSTDLDLRSLETFSLVCRGFYLCARDSEIWRLACLRVWGLNCGNSPHNYLSWRHMYIERNRLLFNGCYIGKTTYIRHGESSFQDQFYRPWHLVTYYRYFRFFPEGFVLVFTSADEPAQSVAQLKYRNARPHILRGYYRLKDDKVTLVVQKKDKAQEKQFLGNAKGNKRRGIELHEVAEQTFHMELQIKSSSKKRHVQLVWTHYSVLTRTHKGDESTCNFDLVQNRFPPLWFSRVKSYTSESDYPLQ